MKFSQILFTATVMVGVMGADLAHAFDYGANINKAGRQRMLTQKLSKEVLMIANGIEVDTAKVDAAKTADLFENSLNELIAEAPSLITKSTLQKVQIKWKRFKPLAATAKTGQVPASVVGAVAAQNLPLLKDSNIAVQALVKKAGDNDNPYAEAVNLAGRQRMLTQKMSKEFYLITYGYEVEKNRAALKKTMTLFEKTLKGLEYGDKFQGLSPAPTAEISAKLQEVAEKWQTFKPHLQTAISGQASDTNKLAVANQNIPLLKTMNQAVQMYAKL